MESRDLRVNIRKTKVMINSEVSMLVSGSGVSLHAVCKRSEMVIPSYALFSD